MTNDRFSRQSFLGQNSQPAIETATIGMVGLGGGGSHIVQQLAHVGFLDYVVYDGDAADESNLNRLVTATEADAANAVPKIDLVRRKILSIRSDAQVEAFPCRWQKQPEALRRCDIVFGCVDGFAERRELEIACRRYLIPLVDIGMDVHLSDDEVPRMGGQVILSMPGSPCMTCLGFLNEASLAREAARYGDAGPHPQVVWPNGVLASMAVGIAVDLLTDWTRSVSAGAGLPSLQRQRRHGHETSTPCLLFRRRVSALPSEPGRRSGLQEILTVIFETVASLPGPIRRSLGRNWENRLGTRSMPPSWPPTRRTA